MKKIFFPLLSLLITCYGYTQRHFTANLHQHEVIAKISSFSRFVPDALAIWPEVEKQICEREGK